MLHSHVWDFRTKYGRPLTAITLVAGLLLATTACGGSAGASSTVPGDAVQSNAGASPPSAAPSPGAPAATVSLAASAAAGSASPSAASAASSSSAPAAQSAAAAGTVKLAVVPDASQVNIRVQELLAGNLGQTEAVESTKAASGAIVLDASGALLPSQSKVQIDLRTLKSDQRIRDNFIQRNPLQTSQFPTADFAPTRIDGLSGLPTSGQHTFTLSGDLTVHGVTKPVSWDVTAQFGPQGLTGQASTAFKMTDFGLTPPKAGPVIQVADGGKIDFTFQAQRAA